MTRWRCRHDVEGKPDAHAVGLKLGLRVGRSYYKMFLSFEFGPSEMGWYLSEARGQNRSGLTVVHCYSRSRSGVTSSALKVVCILYISVWHIYKIGDIVGCGAWPIEDHEKGQERVKRVQKSCLKEASDLDLVISCGVLLLSRHPPILLLTFEKRHTGTQQLYLKLGLSLLD